MQLVVKTRLRRCQRFCGIGPCSHVFHHALQREQNNRVDMPAAGWMQCDGSPVKAIIKEPGRRLL